METYNNIQPSQAPIQLEDASVVHFSQGTTVDSSRAVGYWDAVNENMLCVAPIIDDRMVPEDPIGFYAIGINCCNYRASFHCNDAHRPGARAGLLVLEPHSLAPPGWEWAVDHSFEWANFEKAVNLQKAVYAGHVADGHRFVEWFVEPEKHIRRFRLKAMEAVVLAVVAYMLVVFPFALAQKRRDDVERRNVMLAAQDRARYGAVNDDAQDALAINV